MWANQNQTEGGPASERSDSRPRGGAAADSKRSVPGVRSVTLFRSRPRLSFWESAFASREPRKWWQMHHKHFCHRKTFLGVSQWGMQRAVRGSGAEFQKEGRAPDNPWPVFDVESPFVVRRGESGCVMVAETGVGIRGSP